MPNQTFPNINLHSFLPQNRQPNVTQLTNTGPDPAALEQIKVSGSKCCDKIGFTLRMNSSGQPQF